MRQRLCLQSYADAIRAEKIEKPGGPTAPIPDTTKSTDPRHHKTDRSRDRDPFILRHHKINLTTNTKLLTSHL